MILVVLKNFVSVPEVIVEIKYDKENIEQANKIFDSLAIRKTKYSKYCSGLNILQSNLQCRG